ncbi:MAG: ATP-dependent 6-phosphofructokinase 1 [Turneriella sp.]|nr:ATP-dependent 6-phosphofructokinase 1 [Turneriella sp.]
MGSRSDDKRVAVLSSGGDSPGMNAVLRAFVRSALWEHYQVVGVHNGLAGLLENDFKELSSRDVGLIIDKGGTFLGTARSAEFQTPKGLEKAAANLNAKKIDALCVLGGDGSFRGLMELSEYYKGQLVGIPGTIDNDIPGTEYTIGFDTAVQTAVEAIDKLRDTALSHGRIFFVEVMGRKSGQIALSVAIASGAEDVIIPEEKLDVEEFAKRLEEGRKRGKRFGIIVVAEGAECNSGAQPHAQQVRAAAPDPTVKAALTVEESPAFHWAEVLRPRLGMNIRVSVLGHIQRGGSPTSYDRVWGSRMGEAAVRFLKNRMTGVFTAMRAGNIVPAYLSEATQGVRMVSPEMVQLVRVMGS